MRGLKPVSKLTGLIRFNIATTKPQIKLFRDICKELPRIMTIFEIDIPIVEVGSRQRINHGARRFFTNSGK